MVANRKAREERKDELLRQLIEMEIEELREDGTFPETPHYGVLEWVASSLRSQESASDLMPKLVSVDDCFNAAITLGRCLSVKARTRTLRAS